MTATAPQGAGTGATVAIPLDLAPLAAFLVELGAREIVVAPRAGRPSYRRERGIICGNPDAVLREQSPRAPVTRGAFLR
jgi:hypothetical protein